MRIRCYGARGSLAVSGPKVLKFGGDTTCLEIRLNSGERFIVDAGTGIRRLGRKLVQQRVRHHHILFTHLHWDHVIGFPVFPPLYQPHNTIRMTSGAYTPGKLKANFHKIMHPPGFPVSLKQVVADIRYEPMAAGGIRIGSALIEPIALDHPQGGVGYKITENNRCFVLLTDNELESALLPPTMFDRYAAFCRNADLLLHDAQYTPEEYAHTRGWGHSSYTDAVRLAAAGGVKRLGLFHHDPDRSDAEIDAMVEAARGLIADQGMVFDCFAVAQGDEFTV